MWTDNYRFGTSRDEVHVESAGDLFSFSYTLRVCVIKKKKISRGVSEI